MNYRTKFVKSITNQLTGVYPDIDNVIANHGYVELHIPWELWHTDGFYNDLINALWSCDLKIYDKYTDYISVHDKRYVSILVGVIDDEAGD